MTGGLLDLGQWPLSAIIALFFATALIIALAGVRLTRLADGLADVTGLGEALFGAVLLGGTTSLSGIVTSVVAASSGYAELAVSNAVGGIAAQTAFLAIADMAYHRVNLEHAAASVENLLQSALLATLLAIPLLAMSGPEISMWGIHPASIMLLAAYSFGIRLVSKARSEPLWMPRNTDATRLDTPQEASSQGNTASMWLGFIGLAATVAVCGYLVAQTGIVIVGRTGMSESVVGALFTAVATSLPELVTSVSSVRQGALTLAVGGIIGGNCFDVLFIAFADVAYREGSIYHAISNRQVFIIALTILLTGVLLLGLLRREKSGIANIGFESFLVILLYGGGIGLLAMGGSD
jgi:cation:H+ antiporter